MRTSKSSDVDEVYQKALESLIKSYGFNFDLSLERALQRSNDWQRRKGQPTKLPKKVSHLAPAEKLHLTETVSLDFLMWISRRITARPRSVVNAVPPAKALAYGLALLKIEESLRRGTSLHANASRGSFRRDDTFGSAQDHLFASWRITHLHLSDLYIKRNMKLGTKDCLLAYIDSDHAVLLDIVPHKFIINEEMFDRLMVSAPHIAERYQIHGLTGLAENRTVSSAMKLSKEKINSFFEHKGNFYFQLGFGLTGSGHRIEDVRVLDRLRDEIEKQVMRGHTNLHIKIEAGCLVITSAEVASHPLAISRPLS